MFSSSASILEIFFVAHRPPLLLFINEDEFREGVKSDKSIKKGRWIQPAPLLLLQLVQSRIYSAPTLGRHLSKRVSYRSMMSVITIPVMAKINTPTKTLSV